MIVKGHIRRFNTIGVAEAKAAADCVQRGSPLSGFLGGESSAGYEVSKLENMWREQLGCTHAIACNSATSGLLAACAAVGVANEEVIVSPYTMSATAAAPAFLGADINFVDVEPEHYCLDYNQVEKKIKTSKAIVATNLFGHPAELARLSKLAHRWGSYLIEDNAQAPFAMENNVYAGTIGDIGIFSLNVHKHLQCGEGGIIVTDNDDFATAMRHFINHGEIAGSGIGLNLRMTEVTAAIACAQLSRRKEIIQSRIDLAEKLIEGLYGCPLVTIRPPRENCRHVYYALPMEVHPNVNREWMVAALAAEGVPLREGYVPPLYWMPAFKEFAPEGGCPITEKLHKESLVYFEVCGYDPTNEQIKQIIQAFDKVHGHVRFNTKPLETDQAPKRWYGLSPTVADRGWGRR